MVETDVSDSSGSATEIIASPVLTEAVLCALSAFPPQAQSDSTIAAVSGKTIHFFIFIVPSFS
jgi:hypothetical protein